MLRTILTCALSLLLSLTLGGPVSADEGLKVQVTNVDVSGLPNIRFVLTVTDQDGLSLTDLKGQNVIVTVGSRQIPVSLIEAIDDGGVRISALLAIDASGSMAGAAVTAARNAAGTFIDGIRPNDEVAVVSFADRVEQLTGFTNDVSAARGAVSQIAARGNTALYRAVIDSAAAIAERQAERRVVVLLSDGADFGGVSQVSRQESLEAARGAGVPFYVIGLGSEIDRGYLQELAQTTAGRLFIAPSSSQLLQTFNEVARQVRTQYVVNLNARALPLQGDVTAKLTVEAQGQSGSTEFQFNVPFTIPEEVQAPAAAESKSSSAWLFALIALAFTAGVLYLVWKRIVSKKLAGRVEEAPPPIFRPRSSDGPANAGDIDRPLARLVGADGASLAVGGGVVSIGPDASATYRLPVSAAEFGEGSVRIWPANGRFIVHDTSVRSRLKVNGKILRWGVITNGDKLDICGVSFVFEAIRN